MLREGQRGAFVADHARPAVGDVDQKISHAARVVFQRGLQLLHAHALAVQGEVEGLGRALVAGDLALDLYGHAVALYEFECHFW